MLAELEIVSEYMPRCVYDGRRKKGRKEGRPTPMQCTGKGDTRGKTGYNCFQMRYQMDKQLQL
jgi:hypothetical protein